MSRGDASVWGALILELPREQEDQALALLGAESLGARVDAACDGGSRLTLYFASPDEAAACASTARSWLSGLGGVSGEIRVERVEDGRWVERYQEGLRPIPIGERFLVCPAGRVEQTDRVPIALVPGRAFGTGEHATTRLAAAELERRVARGSSWIDLGCGSGILAVVAHLCGAGSVLAIDIDPLAVEVTREVLAANGIGSSVAVREGTAADLTAADHDGVVANINSGYFAVGGRELYRLVRAGGIVITTGILAEEVAEVSGWLEAAGLEPQSRDTAEGWAVLVLRRADDRVGRTEG